MDDAALRRVMDRQEIVEVLHKYAFAIDDNDWDLLAQVFTPDAVGVYRNGETYEGFEAIRDMIAGVKSELTRTHHIIGNATILTLDEDTATTRCYLWAQHVLEGTPGGDNYVVGGEYNDRFVRTGAGWRIAYRRLDGIWTDGNPGVRGLPR